VNKKQKIKLVAGIVLLLAIVVAGAIFFQHVNVAVLNPKGVIADQQRNLFIFTILLSIVVVVPVFIMLGMFAWKYRDTNPKKATYTPDWSGDSLLETIWWGIPCAIILVLSVITWQTSHSLDPFKPLQSNVKPVNVQVVSLQWKWLFIYPDLGVASVNQLEMPVNTPINFKLTSDAPMNSFWIPNLGSQIYTMNGMSTQLHLMADSTGDYKGSSANISGEGFADMAFTARVTKQADFDNWVAGAKNSQALTADSYADLAKPSTLKQPLTYVLKDQNLYNNIVMKYMTPNMSMSAESAQDKHTGGSSDVDMHGMDMKGMDMNMEGMQ